MLSMTPDERPPCTEMLRHPLFWSNGKRLAFIVDVSDKLDVASKVDPTVVQRFNDMATRIPSADRW